eukprot:TRINITY_DN12776_c0_g1_i1.p1 TRINITY_DN12776_c0_g1~~TRINITY_DN12776_c0_g1_i1.p1  ORF type:complete len:681 (-),score=176.20 TRINITY_DN12776_c0_g1_i1:199-2241(-)
MIETHFKEYDVPLHLHICRDGLEASVKRSIQTHEALIEQCWTRKLEAAVADTKKWAEDTFAPRLHLLNTKLQAESTQARLRMDCTDKRLQEVSQSLARVAMMLAELETRVDAGEDRVSDLAEELDSARDDRRDIRRRSQELVQQVILHVEDSTRQTIAVKEDVEAQLRKAAQDSSQRIQDAEAKAEKADDVLNEEIQSAKDDLKALIKASQSICLKHADDGCQRVEATLRHEDVARLRKSVLGKLDEARGEAAEATAKTAHTAHEALIAGLRSTAQDAKKALADACTELHAKLDSSFDGAQKHSESLFEELARELKLQGVALREEVGVVGGNAARKADEIQAALEEAKVAARQFSEQVELRSKKSIELRSEAMTQVLQQELADARVDLEGRGAIDRREFGEELRKLRELVRQNDLLVREHNELHTAEEIRKASQSMEAQLQQGFADAKQHASVSFQRDVAYSVRCLLDAEQKQADDRIKEKVAAAVQEHGEISVERLRGSLQANYEELSTKLASHVRETVSNQQGSQRCLAVLRADVTELETITVGFGRGISKALQILGLLDGEVGPMTSYMSEHGEVSSIEPAPDEAHAHKEAMRRCSGSLAPQVLEKWHTWLAENDMTEAGIFTPPTKRSILGLISKKVSKADLHEAFAAVSGDKSKTSDRQDAPPVKARTTALLPPL